MNEEVFLDRVSNTIAVLDENRTSERMSFDSVSLKDKDDKTTLDIAKIITDAVATAGAEYSEDSLSTALTITQTLLDNVEMDSVNTIAGKDILASLVAVNIAQGMSATLPFIGNLSGSRTEVKGRTGGGAKIAVYDVHALAGNDMGEIKKGDELVGQNLLKSFVTTSRRAIKPFVAGTLDYTFDLKAIATDANNAEMAKGYNTVIIGGVVMDDHEADDREVTATRTIKVEDVTYTTVFDYAAGTIKVTLDKDIKDGSSIIFKAGLSTEDYEKVAGVVDTKVLLHTYMGQKVIGRVQIKELDRRLVSQEVGLDLQMNSISVALEKAKQENLAENIFNVTSMATPFGELVNIKDSNYDSVGEQYKLFVKEASNAGIDILKESSLTGNYAIIGGKAVADIVNGLKLNAENRSSQADGANIVSKLTTYDGVDYFYAPMLDDLYPAVAGVHTVFVVGNPTKESHKATVSGIGLPILPENGFADLKGNQTVTLSGILIADTNNSRFSSKLVRKLTVKL